MKFTTSFLISIFLLTTIVVALNDNNMKTGGCTPPMSFAKEHNCTLQYSTGNEVAAYTCDDWTIQGDCEGGVISSKEAWAGNKTLITILTVVLTIIFVILLIILVMITMKKPKEEDDEEDIKKRGYY